VGVLPGAEPFTADGGPVGVVVSHGFTGTPQSMRPWAAELAAAGFAVELPLLPGHGTTWQDMNTTRWPDWYGAIEQAFDRLRDRCEQVFAAGLSMGGTLVLRLAEQRGHQVAGLVVVNPSLASERLDVRYALPLLRRFVPSLAGIGSDIAKPGVTELAYDRTPLKALHSLSQLWRITRADLGRITAPVLLYRSETDHVVEPLSGRLLRGSTRAGLVDERVLARSYHVATLDHDAPEIFAGSIDWIKNQGSRPERGPAGPGTAHPGPGDPD
jgi:carboxylesterase